MGKKKKTRKETRERIGVLVPIPALFSPSNGTSAGGDAFNFTWAYKVPYGVQHKFRPEVRPVVLLKNETSAANSHSPMKLYCDLGT